MKNVRRLVNAAELAAARGQKADRQFIKETVQCKPAKSVDTVRAHTKLFSGLIYNTYIEIEKLENFCKISTYDNRTSGETRLP